MRNRSTGASLDILLSAAAFDPSELPQLQKAADQALATTLQDLGIPTAWTADLQVEPGPLPCRISIEGELLLLSASRTYLVTAGVAGHHEGAEPPQDVAELMTTAVAALGSGDRANLVAELVRAHLLGNLSALVDRTPEDPAHPWTSSDHPLNEPVRLAARLGIGPIRLERVGTPSLPTSGDPFRICEQLLEDADLRGSPVIEMNEATLRQVTTSANLTRPWSINPPGPRTSLGTSVGIAAALWNDYGLAVPGCELAIDRRLPDHHYRFRFGEVATPSYVFLADDVVALTCLDPGNEDAPALGWTLDPVGGGWWPLVATSWARSLPDPGRSYFDSIGMLLRTFYAEIQARAARWAASGTALDFVGASLGPPLSSEVSAVVPVVIRWLLADGVSVGQPGPVIEGIVRVLVTGDHSTAALVAAARSQLGGAVMGHVPSEHPVVTIHLDPAAARRASDSGSVGPLLETQPELLTTTATTMVVCPADHRAAVTELLRPLLDVMHIVAPDEVADATFNLPESQGV